MTLAMLDLDHFKAINDTYGHLTGDEVLTRVAAVLARSLRESDFVARWGGEEMVVMFPDTGMAGASVALGKAMEAMRAEVFEAPGGRTFHVTFSAGLAEVVPGERLDGAVAAADRLLYAAKDGGRDRLVTAAPAP
jgi:diguanylate cyclase (GGDEF)-like protein